jgi:hypothetical protein
MYAKGFSMQTILNSCDIGCLQGKAREMRIEIVTMIERSGSGHKGKS